MWVFNTRGRSALLLKCRNAKLPLRQRKKYVLSISPDNATANPPADRFHSVITLITPGKAEEAENINREKFLQAILTEFFLEYPILRKKCQKAN